jgi:uncharacterized protein (TIRG00374 family)
MFKKIIPLVLRIGISIILLFFLFKFQHVDTQEVLKSIKNADKGLLLLALVIYLFAYILALFRWEMLLKGAKIHLSLKRVIMSFSGGVFFNALLPSSIGGDVVRSVDLATHTKRPREVIATVLLDRLSGYVGLVIVALLSLLFGWKLIHHKSVLLSIAIITGILIAVLLVLFNRFLYSKINRLLHSPRAGKIRETIKNLHQEIHIFRQHKKIIANNLILSVLIQVIGPLTFYITALALGIKINIIYFFIYLPIIGAITLLPISIGGLGLRENITKIFFVQAGVVDNAAVAMAILNTFFIFVYAAIGGLIYVLTIHHRRIQYHTPHHVQPHS